jgi:hypothetical protein
MDIVKMQWIIVWSKVERCIFLAYNNIGMNGKVIRWYSTKFQDPDFWKYFCYFLFTFTRQNSSIVALELIEGSVKEEEHLCLRFSEQQQYSDQASPPFLGSSIRSLHRTVLYGKLISVAVVVDNLNLGDTTVFWDFTLIIKHVRSRRGGGVDCW